VAAAAAVGYKYRLGFETAEALLTVDGWWPVSAMSVFVT